MSGGVGTYRAVWLLTDSTIFEQLYDSSGTFQSFFFIITQSGVTFDRNSTGDFFQNRKSDRNK